MNQTRTGQHGEGGGEGRIKTMKGPFNPLKVGQWVGVLAVTQYAVGELESWDDNFIVLKAGWSQVFETGDYDQFYGEGVADLCQRVPAPVALARTGIQWVGWWPHEFAPLNKKDVDEDIKKE